MHMTFHRLGFGRCCLLFAFLHCTSRFSHANDKRAASVKAVFLYTHFAFSACFIFIKHNFVFLSALFCLIVFFYICASGMLLSLLADFTHLLLYQVFSACIYMTSSFCHYHIMYVVASSVLPCITYTLYMDVLVSLSSLSLLAGCFRVRAHCGIGATWMVFLFGVARLFFSDNETTLSLFFFFFHIGNTHVSLMFMSFSHHARISHQKLTRKYVFHSVPCHCTRGNIYIFDMFCIHTHISFSNGGIFVYDILIKHFTYFVLSFFIYEHFLSSHLSSKLGLIKSYA